MDKNPVHPLLIESGLIDRVGFLLRVANGAVWQNLVGVFDPFDLRPAHFSVMLMLRTRPGCRQQDIGEALAIQRPNLTTTIDGLKRRGLVQQTVNPADRRSQTLMLTDAGRVSLAEMEQAHRLHEAKVAEALEGEDAAACARMLRKLAGLGE